jgi:tetratricopeptide (TPR) repeat protein
MDAHYKQLIERGKEAYARKNYPAALSDLGVVVEQYPHFADIRHMMGLCLSFLGQTETAIEEFDRALEINDGYVEAHLNRAIALTELGRYDEARASFEKASQHEGASPGRFPAAVTAKVANAHMAVGDLYMEANAPEPAADEYRRALELRPRFHDIRNRLAEALMQMGLLDTAVTELNTILEANPRFLAARLNLGLVLYRRGELEAARAEWETARSQSPDDGQVRAYLAMLQGQGPEPGIEPAGEA